MSSLTFLNAVVDLVLIAAGCVSILGGIFQIARWFVDGPRRKVRTRTGESWATIGESEGPPLRLDDVPTGTLARLVGAEEHSFLP